MPRPRARMSILGSSVRSSVGGISPALARAVLPAALAFGALALVVGFPVLSANPSALWNIVHEKCEPHWLAANDPAPCARVDMRGGADGGVAILKDLVGVAQYLAIPTRRISGTESPILLAPDAPDLFAAAWSARQFTFERLGKELPRDGIGLAINSALSRSQDQAHIHVDCLRLDIRAELARLAPHIAAGWSPEAVVLDGKPYRVLRIDGPELNGVNQYGRGDYCRRRDDIRGSGLGFPRPRRHCRSCQGRQSSWRRPAGPFLRNREGRLASSSLIHCLLDIDAGKVKIPADGRGCGELSVSGAPGSAHALLLQDLDGRHGATARGGRMPPPQSPSSPSRRAKARFGSAL